MECGGWLEEDTDNSLGRASGGSMNRFLCDIAYIKPSLPVSTWESMLMYTHSTMVSQSEHLDWDSW